MQLEITEEVHNRVVWQVRTPLVRIELTLLAIWLIAILLLIASGSAIRWALVIAVTVACAVGALALALRIRSGEVGLLERTPEGGVVRRERRWLLRRTPLVWEIPMDEVISFAVEPQLFEETSGQTYTLARLWVLHADGQALRLVDWLNTRAVLELGSALSRAGRRPLYPERSK
ncbi:MAG TPA: hypothetical protein ENN14_00595 [Chloroflexi bacterium]|nr:hypothetical protein [Chloroflexota bacterium]